MRRGWRRGVTARSAWRPASCELHRRHRRPVERAAALAAEFDLQLQVEDGDQAGRADEDGVGQQAAALAGDERLAGDVFGADADEQGGQLQPEVAQELLAAQERQRELAEDVGAVEDLGGDGGGRRRQAEEDAVALVAVLAAELVGGDGRLSRQAQAEIALASAGAGRQAQQRLDQDGLRIPGNGLIVQGQAGFFIAVVQRLRLGADPVQRPEVIHGPVAPALDPEPHRVPPRRTARAAGGRSSSPPPAAHESGRAGTPRQRLPGPFAGRATDS